MLTSLTVLVCCLGNSVDINDTYYGDHLFDLLRSIRRSINAAHLWSSLNSLYLWHLSIYMNNGKTRIEFHESIHNSFMETQQSLMVLISYGDPSSNIGLQNACQLWSSRKHKWNPMIDVTIATMQLWITINRSMELHNLITCFKWLLIMVLYHCYRIM